MELWYAPTSPFARKVRVVAHELGIADDIRLVEVDPWRDARLHELNPLAKVPTLVMDSGEVVWESGVIAERLEALAGAETLFPRSAPQRWLALSLQALADGASTAAGRLFADENRPPPERSDAMTARFRTAIDACLDHFDRNRLMSSPTIGEISVAVFAGYLDFRWPGLGWRSGRPKLAGWFDAFAQRPSMIRTAHRLLG